MRGKLLLFAVVFLGWAMRGPSTIDAREVATIEFDKHIRPIFTKNCTACHGGVKQAGDVSFIYKDQVLPPDGWIVEPGDPDASVLIERILETDPDLQMPPPDHGPRLSEEEINLLTEWIRQGAQWNASHWAYGQIEPQTAPEVSDLEWSDSRIDRFVENKMREHGLSPSPAASPQRWLRRATLDLTGLPPTPAERTEFLAAFERDADAAREDTVDRLLNSPAFGERWASVWLDQIRYADSKGLGLDGRRSIWKFRDWVIEALNSDMPFDQFTIKQMAGDLLPNPSIDDYVATAAHRLTQTNEEGGTDDEEFRIGAVLDRVDTTWQAWQGVTFGCVQCHAHPYDPFRHEEFYQFSAFFNDTADCDLNEDWPVVQAPIDPAKSAEATEIDQQIDALKSTIWAQEYELLSDDDAWTPVRDLTAKSSNATRLGIESKDDHDEFYTIDTISRNLTITLTAPISKSIDKLSAIRLTILPLAPETAVSDSEWGFVLSNISAKLKTGDTEQPIDIKRLIIDEADPFYNPQKSLDSKSNDGFAAYTRIHYPRQAALILDSPMEIPEDSQLVVSLRNNVFILASFSLVTRRGHLEVTSDERFTELLHDESLLAKRKSLDDLKSKRRKIASVSVPVLKQRPSHLSRPTFLFERGLFLTKGQAVSADVPEILSFGSTPTNRLELAQWMVNGKNPLTSRVLVNRIWARLFGVGIVATEEDFGSSGEPPTHPELLDDLAWRFQTEMDWSQKQLIREMVLSKTYAQTAIVDQRRRQLDPGNRWLSSGPRHRLSSEIIRDQALALSGLLSDKQFGPPVHPPIPGGVWQPFQGGDKWNVPGKDNEDRYRRSIYTYTKRSIPYPMFAAFDAPSREFCTPRRLLSNTPTQALTMLNDVTFRECAKALAMRMVESGDEPVEQIRNGFVRVTCRDPRPNELEALTTLETQTDMESVATVLLNLDEVVTK